MHYLIYIPEASGMVVDLAKVGLEDLGGGIDWRPARANETPDGKAGLLGTWLKANPKVQVDWDHLDLYDWTHSPPQGDIPKGAYWLGIHKQREQKPGPADLIRSEFLDGFNVTLADNREWIIPSAQRLPKSYAIDNETGKRIHKMSPEHQLYSEKAFSYAQLFFVREEEIKFLARMAESRTKVADIPEGTLTHLTTVDGEPITTVDDLETTEFNMNIELVDGFNHCCLGLSLNYRLNEFIIGELELLDDQAMVAACQASMDIPTIQEALKKNEPESPISIPGGSLI